MKFTFCLFNLEHLQLEFEKLDCTWISVDIFWLSIKFKVFDIDRQIPLHFQGFHSFFLGTPDYALFWWNSPLHSMKSKLNKYWVVCIFNTFFGRVNKILTIQYNIWKTYEALGSNTAHHNKIFSWTSKLNDTVSLWYKFNCAVKHLSSSTSYVQIRNVH